MKAYVKPEIELKGYKSGENFAADQWGDVFGTGVEIPVSAFTLGDDTSYA